MFEKIVKPLFRHKSSYLIAGIIIGCLITSLILINKQGIFENRLINEKDYGKDLEKQIGILRNETEQFKYKLSHPNPLLYVPKENLSGNNIFNLKCFDTTNTQNEVPSDIITKLNSKLSEKIIYGCLNTEVNQIVFISTNNDKYKTGTYKLQQYSTQSEDLKTIVVPENILAGNCMKIVTWSRSGNLYYQCSGLNGGEAIYRYNFKTSTHATIEDCGVYQFQAGSEKVCRKYCQTNAECGIRMNCDNQSNICQWKDEYQYR